jgi:hypothetical protein
MPRIMVMRAAHHKVFVLVDVLAAHHKVFVLVDVLIKTLLIVVLLRVCSFMA